MLWAGCSDETFQAPESERPAALDLTDLAPADQLRELVPARSVLRRSNDALLRRPDVVATAVGLTDAGRPAIQVYVSGPRLDDELPEIDGVPVVVIEAGPIVALQDARQAIEPRPGPPCPPKCGGGGGGGGSIDPTARFPRPVPIGVSIGHPDITAGTLGARVKRDGSVFILSNNHVLANSNLGSNGDAALQPGPFDGGSEPADEVGTLADYVPIVFSTSASNVVDAAIAGTTTSQVGNATPSDGYGTPSSGTVEATLGLRVTKYGRTTGLTKGRVQGIDATVNVGYPRGTARFVRQIVIGGGGFSRGGDSGSLIVVQNGVDRGKAVGLLFAGGGGVTIANPIDDVLSELSVTIDGN